MRKFRVIRGVKGGFGYGLTFKAETLKDALRQDRELANKNMSMDGLLPPTKPNPVIAVYELVPVPEADWK